MNISERETCCSVKKEMQRRCTVCGKMIKKGKIFEKRGKRGRQLVLPWGGWISPQESVSGAGNETRHPGKNSESDSSNCPDKFHPKYLPKMLPNLLPHYSSSPQISPSFHILRFKRAPQLRPSQKGCRKENISLF